MRKYNLLKYGDSDFGYRYILQIYSGTAELSLLLDTGSKYNYIMSDALQGCLYDRAIEEDGKLKGVLLSFNLAKSSRSVKDCDYGQTFLINDEITEKILSLKETEGLKVAGILGTQFLQNSSIDLESLKISPWLNLGTKENGTVMSLVRLILPHWVFR